MQLALSRPVPEIDGYHMKRRFCAIVLLLLLAACGQPEIGERTATTSVAATAPSTSTALAVASPTPVATYVAALVDITAPDDIVTPTTANQPLVVSPIVTSTIELQIGDQTLLVELASTPEQRGRGLMARSQLLENTGMLFVFPSDQNLSFWMRDTPLPLSIAFIDTNQVILNLEDMQPFDDQTFHLSNGPARYALEVNQGWFAQHGINAGDRVTFRLPDNLDIR